MHLFAALAEKERRSARGTRWRRSRERAGLAIAQTSPRLAKPLPRRYEPLRMHAANVLPIIREFQRAAAKSLRVIADALNARGVPRPGAGGGKP